MREYGHKWNPNSNVFINYKRNVVFIIIIIIIIIISIIIIIVIIIVIIITILLWKNLSPNTHLAWL